MSREEQEVVKPAQAVTDASERASQGNGGQAAGARVIKSTRIRLGGEPRMLMFPSESAEPALALRKENGVVKGFRYRCVCGHTDEFICE